MVSIAKRLVSVDTNVENRYRFAIEIIQSIKKVCGEDFVEVGLYLPFAKAVRDAVDVPVLCAGRMDDPEVATKAIENGDCDMIGLGRTLLADPYYPLKLQTGHEENIRWCLNCNVGCGSKILQIAHLGCAVNPQCAYESEDPLAGKIANEKNMVIVVKLHYMNNSLVLA